MAVAVSVIMAPVLLCIFSFYKWLYAFFETWRLSRKDALYQGNRLYRIAEVTMGAGTGAGVNTIFGICFIFSVMPFVCGRFFATPGIYIFEQEQQRWTEFLQLGICLIFMVIYFSILSFLQVMDLKRMAGNIRFLFHMGKNKAELRVLFCTQVIIKMFLPAFMSFILIWTAIPFINYRLNLILPISMNYLLIKAACGFMACFFALCLCYCCVICIISMRYIKANHP